MILAAEQARWLPKQSIETHLREWYTWPTSLQDLPWACRTFRWGVQFGTGCCSRATRGQVTSKDIASSLRIFSTEGEDDDILLRPSIDGSMSAVSILGTDVRQAGSQLVTSDGKQDLRKRPESGWGASEKQKLAFQAAELIEVMLQRSWPG